MVYTTSLGADYYDAERDWLTPPRERDEEEEYEPNHDDIVTPGSKVISARGVSADEAAHGVGYIPHWATCPGADQARRQGR